MEYMILVAEDESLVGKRVIVRLDEEKYRRLVQEEAMGYLEIRKHAVETDDPDVMREYGINDLLEAETVFDMDGES